MTDRETGRMDLDDAKPVAAADVSGIVRPRRSRLGVRLLAGAGAFLLVLLVAAGALAWRAAHGGIGLEPVRGQIEAQLRQRLPASAILTIGSAALSIEEGGVVVLARDVRMALPGMATATIGELSTAATPAALFRGTIDLRTVRASKLAIGVTLPGAAAFTGTPADLLARIARDLMRQANAADDILRGTGLDGVLVEDASVSVLDAAGRSGPPLRIGQGTWSPLGEVRSKVWVQVVKPGGAGWDVTVERNREAPGRTNLVLEVQNAPVAALAPEFGKARDGFYLDTTLALQVRLSQEGEGQPALRGVLSAGAGVMSVGGRERMELSGANLTFRLSPDGRRLSLPTGNIATRTGRVEFQGTAELGSGEGIGIVARLVSGVLPVAAGPAVTLTGGEVVARLAFADLSWQVERARVRTADGEVSLAGAVSLLGPAATGLSLAISFPEIPVATMRAIWPPFVSSKVRSWIDENVRSGRIGPGTLQVALPPDYVGRRGRDKVIPPYGLVGALPFREAAFTPLKTFPVVANGSGSIDFAKATATIVLQSGVAAVADKGAVDATGTTLTVPELGRKQATGDLHLEIGGPAAALAVLSDTPPLHVAVDRGISADALTGEAVLSLDATIPLYDGGDVNAIDPSFRLALNTFGSTLPIENRLIADADLTLEGRPAGFTVKGRAELDGLEANVDLVLGAAGRSDVTLVLDAAARKKLGLDFGGALTGDVKAAVKTVASDPARPGTETLDVVLDLKDARIALPALGWEKGPGVAATAHFRLDRSPSGTEVSNLLLTGKGFSAQGGLSVGPDGKLREVKLSKVALRAGDDLSAEIQAAKGGFAVAIRGRSLDARGIIRGLSSGFGDGAATGMTLAVTLDVDEVVGENGVSLSAVAGTLGLKSGKVDRVNLAGSLGDGARVEWSVAAKDGGRSVRLRTGDAGALIRFGGVYGKVVGGDLALQYDGPLGGTGTGLVMMRNFRIQNERALDTAIETAAGPGNPRDVMRAPVRGNDMIFSQLRLPFRQQGFVVVLDDAALRGPSLGATASGTINIPGGKIALSGTFIPAFGLNNIAGSIPLLGVILGGGRNEGLVGITYKLFGPIGSPSLTMNPLSAIAPGIFRKIFEYN